MKKILAIIMTLLVCFSVAGCDKFKPYKITETITKNSDYSVRVVEGQKYTTIAKYKNGEISDEDFKILTFTDCHLDHYQNKASISMQMIIKNIVNEKPDLVVFLGDTITSSFNTDRAKQLCEVMEELGVYWDLVLGNHEQDNIFSMSRSAQVRLFDKYEHCLMDSSVKKVDGKVVEGYGNHVVNILGSNNKVIQSLYFIDGHQDMTNSDIKKYKSEVTKYKSEYDYIKENQIKWYENTVKDIESANGSNPQSTIFCHIPLQEFADAYNKVEATVNPKTTITPTTVGSGDEMVELLTGARRERECVAGHNTGLFNKIIELGSTKAVFSGHDHINNYVLRYKGILLGYCENSGYSSYNLYTKGLNQTTLLKGYSIYTITQSGNQITQNQNGNLLFEQVTNASKWPDMQESILSIYGTFVDYDTQQANKNK